MESRLLLAADLVGQWRAEDLASELADGTVLVDWPDSVGDATALATGSPTLVHRAVGGRSVVRFSADDGVDTFQVAADANALTDAEAFSVAVVFRTTSTSLAGAETAYFLNTPLIDASGFFGSTPDWSLVLSQAGSVGGGLGGGPISTVYSDVAGLNDGQTHIAIYAVEAGVQSLRIDDHPLQTVAGGNTDPRAPHALTFGAADPDLRPFSGDLAEIRLYHGALSAEESAALYTTLLADYTNTPPLAEDDTYQVDEDQLLSVSAAAGVLANDTNGGQDPLTATLVDAPQHGSLTLASDGSFDYLPAAEYSGTDSFTYLANNREPSNLARVTIEVAPVLDLATAVADTYVVEVGSSLLLDATAGVLANDLNPEGRTVTVELSQDVSAGDLSLSPDGSLLFDPQAFVGTTSFQYQVRDLDQLSEPVTVTLHVDHSPVAMSDAYQIEEDGLLRVAAGSGLLQNDLDADGDVLSVRLVTAPMHGTLHVWRADGSFVYQPDANYFGTETIEYVVSDGDQDSAPGSVRLEVTSVNDRPRAVADSYAVSPVSGLSLTGEDGLLKNDSDRDGDPLTATLITPPSHGTLEWSADGGVRYEPSPGFRGSDELVYAASDGASLSDPVTVHFQVADEQVAVSKFVAANDDGLLDYYGDDSDWIEIVNLEEFAIDLQGWYLSDDASRPDLWMFTESTILGPQERLVVFASGRDLRTPNGEWHTNFGLAREGGALLLVRPDGITPAWSLEASYPSQFGDVAYGLTDIPRVTPLVERESTTLLTIPQDGSLGTEWTTLGFDDSGWQSSQAMVGWGAEGPVTHYRGFETRFIDVEGGLDGRLESVTEAEQLFLGTFDPADYQIATDVTVVVDQVDFGGSPGTFDSTQPYPDGTSDQSLSDFAMRARATVTIPPGDWSIGVGSAGGHFLRLEGVSFLDTLVERGEDLIDGDGEIRHETDKSLWTVGTFHVGPRGLTTTLEAVTFSRSLTDRFELAISDLSEVSLPTANTWQLLSDGALGWSVESVVPRPAPFYTNRVEGTLPPALEVEPKSAYLRLPFTLKEEVQYDTLSMRVEYDDGFIAYLNGVEIARRNVSGPSDWQTSADEDRSHLQAVIAESIDVSPFVDRLQVGENILAIHAVSWSEEANGLLIAPELTVSETSVHQLGYLAEPQAGSPNDPGFLGVAAAPVFSQTISGFASSFELELATATPDAVIRYTTDGSVPDRNSPTYGGPLTVSDTVQIRAQAFRPSYVPSAVNSQTFVRLEADLVDFDSNLPLLVLETYGDDVWGKNTGEMTVSELSIYEPGDDGRSSLTDTPVHSSRAGFRTRGRSSSGFPKAPYRVELWQDGDDRDLNASLLGMPPDGDWVLLGPWLQDLSMTRDPFAFGISNGIGFYATRTRYVEVFLNTDGGSLGRQDYRGVYVLGERIEGGPGRVPITDPPPAATTEPDITGGYLIRIDEPAPNELTIRAGGRTLRIAEPTRDELLERPEQVAWVIQFIDEFGAALNSPQFTHPEYGHYRNYIDVATWVDHHLLSLLTMNRDALGMSTAMYLPREGKLSMGPIWDVDQAMGSAIQPGQLTDAWLPSRFSGWWRRLFQDPDFVQDYIDRWQELRDGEFSTESMHRRVDGLADQIREAQVRNFEIWTENLPRFSDSQVDLGKFDGTWEGEIAHQKEWLKQHAEWVDAQLLARPGLSLPGGLIAGPVEVELSGPAGADIYYTLDGSDPRLPGGGISPVARRYDGPITVAESTRIQTRSMDRSFNSTVSPTLEHWSGLKTADFRHETSPAEGLRVAELHYHPADPTLDEILAGYGDAEAFEFVELVNIGPLPVDLTEVAFVRVDIGTARQGIDFAFADADQQLLAPGERVVVVRDLDAFRLRYGSGPTVAGVWDGGLSNSREQLTLQAGSTIIQQFSYDDDWHPSTDGRGPSLEIVDATAALDRWSEAAGWLPSSESRGTPSSPAIAGDFDGNRIVDDNDIDQLMARLRLGGASLTHDLTDDARVDQNDLQQLVVGILGTEFGDTDLDGDVDVQSAGGTGDGERLLASLGTGPGRRWRDGDFNGDGLVTASADGATLLAALGATTDTADLTMGDATAIAAHAVGERAEPLHAALPELRDSRGEPAQAETIDNTSADARVHRDVVFATDQVPWTSGPQIDTDVELLPSSIDLAEWDHLFADL